MTHRWGIPKKRARVQHAWCAESEFSNGMSALCRKPSRRTKDEIDFDATAAKCEKCVKLAEGRDLDD